MGTLTSNFSSQYFEASNKLKGDKQNLIRVFVEGYDDVPFWRTILEKYETKTRKFEISIPTRSDLAKGKKVLLKMIPDTGDNFILCMDSDFDYIFGDLNEQSRLVNQAPYVFHTYAYSTENYACYPPSLHGLCVRATKNDRDIFDFEIFMREYSKIIYPLFIWYAFSAYMKIQQAFTLADFKNAVKINFLAFEENGLRTLEWVDRQSRKRLAIIESHNRRRIEEKNEFESYIRKHGVNEENVFMFMQGHTLKDNIVIVLLQSVCERLRDISIGNITSSDRRGVALRNELSNYNNSLRNVKEVLNDNDNYTDSPLFAKLTQDLENYIKKLK